MSNTELNQQAVFNFDGKDYVLKPPSIKTEIHYVRFLEERAVEKVRSKKEMWGPEFSEAVASLNRDQTVGVYEWGTKEFWRSLDQELCLAELCYLTLKEVETSMSRDKFAALWKSQHYVGDKGRSNKIGTAMWGFLVPSKPSCSVPE